MSRTKYTFNPKKLDRKKRLESDCGNYPESRRSSKFTFWEEFWYWTPISVIVAAVVLLIVKCMP